MSGRYFLADEPELREKLDYYLGGVRERLGRAPFARAVAFLLLAGGYGRGEGGIFKSTEESPPSLYNDLEFYLVMHSRAALGVACQWCTEESHRGEHETGIEVEFKLLTLSALRRAEPSMFIYDLLSAHQLVYGDALLVQHLPQRLRDDRGIPVHEATRLLFNRGTGLLFSREALAGNSDRVRNGFIERNHAKIRLALADAVLTLNGRYHFSCIERHGRLNEPLAEQPPNWDKLIAWHAAGVEFKLHPRHQVAPAKTLNAQQQELTDAWRELFLWLESIRLQQLFPSAHEYVAYNGRVFPEIPAVRNWLLHLRDRLRRGNPPGSWRDYPRANLQRALVLLLEPHVESDILSSVARVLSLPTDSPGQLIRETYLRWWRYYN